MKWRAIMAWSAAGLLAPGAAMAQSEGHSEDERIEVHQMETMEIRPKRAASPSDEEGAARSRCRFLEAPRSFVPELLESADEL